MATRPYYAPITAAEKKRIVSLFDKQPHPSSISRKVGINLTSVRKILSEAGRTLPSNSEIRKFHFPVNETAFDVLTEEARYWLGFLMADGNLNGETHRITLSLQARDLTHLECFRAFAGVTQHGVFLTKGSYFTSFVSVYMATRLRELGIVPRKSLIATAPECLSDCKLFWLGVLDGDGSLCVSAERNWPIISLLGSKALMHQYHRYISAQLPFEVPLPRQTKNVWVVNAGGWRAIALVRHFWEGHAFGLARKRETAMKLIRDYSHLQQGKKRPYQWKHKLRLASGGQLNP